jgi:hypothetical protein
MGAARLSDSVASGNEAARGGGFFNYDGQLTLSNSTVEENSAGEGGGVYGYGGAVVIDHSTLSTNTATLRGGGLFILADQATLANSTISGNTAGFRGGGLYNQALTTLTNATLTANVATQEGGGIFNDGTVVFVRSLLSGNTAANYGELYNSYGGSVIANNYNLFGHSAAHGSNVEPGLLDLVPEAVLDEILDPLLGDNGGLPTGSGLPTYTHALPPGSPAIDRAPSEDCDFAPVSGRDQRHAPRNVDGNAIPSANECDSGAIERQPAAWLLFLPAVMAP